MEKISCLCVTRNRYALLKRALLCFLYQNKIDKVETEILLVHEDESLKIIDKIKQDFIAFDNIRYLYVPSQPKMTLGALRNLSIEKASGDYVTQWDDDDLYHPNRLKTQYQMAKQNKTMGNMVNQIYMYDMVEKTAYLSQVKEMFEGSLFVKRALFTKNDDYRYLDMERAEETDMCRKLVKQKLINTISTPHLYLYTYHGSNTWNRQHFKDIFNISYKRSAAVNNAIAELVAAKTLLTKDRIINALPVIKYPETS